LLVEETCDEIRAAARAAGFVDRQVFSIEKGFSWDTLYAESRALSLFSNKRIFEIRLPSGKAEKKGADILLGLFTQPDPDLLVIVVTGKLDRKSAETAWMAALHAKGVSVTLWPVAGAELPGWLQQRARRKGFELTPDAALLLAHKSEGNLLAAAQELRKLELLAGDATQLDLALVRDAIADNAKFDIFQLAEAASAGELERATHILESLQGEGAEPTLVLWALVREIRGLWQSSEQSRLRGSGRSGWNLASTPSSAATQRLSKLPLARLLETAFDVDRIVKGQLSGDAWVALTALTLGLAGDLPPDLLRVRQTT
jgi:DNA polymerase-3 subunit delta